MRGSAATPRLCLSFFLAGSPAVGRDQHLCETKMSSSSSTFTSNQVRDTVLWERYRPSCVRQTALQIDLNGRRLASFSALLPATNAAQRRVHRPTGWFPAWWHERQLTKRPEPRRAPLSSAHRCHLHHQLGRQTCLGDENEATSLLPTPGSSVARMEQPPRCMRARRSGACARAWHRHNMPPVRPPPGQGAPPADRLEVLGDVLHGGDHSANERWGAVRSVSPVHRVTRDARWTISRRSFCRKPRGDGRRGVVAQPQCSRRELSPPGAIVPRPLHARNYESAAHCGLEPRQGHDSRGHSRVIRSPVRHKPPGRSPARLRAAQPARTRGSEAEHHRHIADTAPKSWARSTPLPRPHRCR